MTSNPKTLARLDAVFHRLEAVNSKLGGKPGNTRVTSSKSEFEKLVQQLESATVRIESRLKTPGDANGDGSPSVQGFDQVLNDKLAKFFQLCYEIGGDVKDQGALMKEAFTAQREFLVWVSGRGRQPQDVMSTKLKSTSDKISEVQAFCNSHRGSKQFNHLSGVSEGVAALAWVAAPGKPSSFVKEKCDAAQFYTNRVLKDFKDKEPKHAEWARGLIGALKQLEEYVRDNHSVTLSWGM